MLLSQSTLRITAALAVSLVLGCTSGCGNGTKNLVVADTINSRVLVYNTPLSTNESASVVLGQPNFTDGAQSLASSNTVGDPYAVTTDQFGNLYVADDVNCRVLRFAMPLTNGKSADLVIGQPDFNSGTCLTGSSATASGMGFPSALAFDDKGNLWVSDGGNSRVLEYVPPFHNGMAASLALGQNSTGATSDSFPCNRGGASASASTLCGPQGLSLTPRGTFG